MVGQLLHAASAEIAWAPRIEQDGLQGGNGRAVGEVLLEHFFDEIDLWMRYRA